MTDIVTIERLGQRGEGIAQTPQGRLYVPYALAGEEVRVTREGERGVLMEVLEPSAERIAAFCPYFTRCGGCAVQTLAPAAYAAWKRGLLVSALSLAGVEAEVAPLVDAHGDGRRRATFHARVPENGRVEVGFMQARAHKIIEIEACPILDPRLGHALATARTIAKALMPLGKPLDIIVSATDSGVDIDLRGPGKLDEASRQKLVEAALAHDVARLSNHGIIVLERRRPVLRMGEALLEPPPGAFLQATEAGEKALAVRTVTALKGAKRIADLFSGVGTFALRLAAHADVEAFDNERAALDALSKASRGPSVSRPVEVHVRDLFHRPLLPAELAGFDAVVLDPPRAGAEAQMHALAASSVPQIVSIACDAQSFSRDAAILIAAGYQAEIIEPIDQFRYSAHMEIFSLFRRTAPKKKRRLLG
jgi:23S rRNA (uracil1939-C5)-methyltransferase